MSDQPQTVPEKLPSGMFAVKPHIPLPRRFLGPRWWGMWIGLGFLWLLLFLPQRWRAWMGERLGDLFYHVSKRSRRSAERNLELCFPDIDPWLRKDLLRRHFRAFGTAVMGVSLIWWASVKRLQGLIRFRNREHYDRACEAGQNIILLAPHFIALEIAGVFLAHERRILTMYKKPRNDLLDWVMRRQRLRFGGGMIERDSNLKALIRIVRNHIPFYYLPDQNPGEASFVFAPFFGVPTATLTALSRLTRMTDAVVIPCFARILPKGAGYEIIFKAPLENFPTEDPIADATRMNRIIEDAIREMPEQYIWTYRRFKNRPPGEPSVYG
jgi:lipid A biosynthesis lauroyl/palmitoleoyl acyltransferase